MCPTLHIVDCTSVSQYIALCIALHTSTWNNLDDPLSIVAVPPSIWSWLSPFGPADDSPALRRLKLYLQSTEEIIACLEKAFPLSINFRSAFTPIGTAKHLMEVLTSYVPAFPPGDQQIFSIDLPNQNSSLAFQIRCIKVLRSRHPV